MHVRDHDQYPWAEPGRNARHNFGSKSPWGLSFSAPNELWELGPRGLSFNASLNYQGASTPHGNPVGLQVDLIDSVVQLNVTIAQNPEPYP